MIRLIMIVGIFLAVPTLAQDISEHHEHESVAGKFYSTWNRPPSRQWSCCNRRDCRALETGELKRHGETWFIRSKTGQWLAVPDNVIEQKRPDPHDSPDGRTHVCASEWQVFCFTLGAEG